MPWYAPTCPKKFEKKKKYTGNDVGDLNAEVRAYSQKQNSLAKQKLHGEKIFS
jgi:hypothetical protein